MKSLDNSHQQYQSYTSSYDGSNERFDNIYTEMSPTASLMHEDTDKMRKDGKEERRADPQRFYILLVFSMLAFTQAVVWNTWGSISSSVEYAFGWQDSTIAILSNWGPITYMISTVFFAWLLDVKGLRVGLLVTSTLVTCGCGLRCITSTPPSSTHFIHLGQMLNGLAGPVAMGAPPLVSALWFPEHERIKSTAIGTIASGFGVAVSFIIAPLMVPDVKHVRNVLGPGQTDPDVVVQHIRESIMFLMKLEFAWSIMILVMIVVHYPSKPKYAPSITAGVQRVQFKQAVFSLLQNRNFWMLGLPYAISCGIYAAWGTVYYVNVKPLGISEVTAGWVAFSSMVMAQVVGLTLSIFADMFGRKMKQMIVYLYIIGSVAFCTFTLMYVGFLPFSNGLLYLTNVAGGAAIGGAPPLLYALVCESTFPIAEGITNLFMTCLNNMAGLIFLLIPLFVSGTSWMNWLLTFTITLCIPIFSMFPEQEARAQAKLT